MDCPDCQAQNPHDAAACVGCGRTLGNVCTACGHVSPAGSRFCAGCGARYGDAGSQSAPPADAPAAVGDAPSQAFGEPGERRQLTILFADLVGSVAHASQLDPEDWGETLAHYHGLAKKTVERFGGRVTQFLGDGVLACFGYPTAHEDDPERAVRAGLALVEAVRGSLRICADDGREIEQLRVRVGIHTGLTVVTDSGVRISVFGDTPNVTARVQSIARSDTVVVTGVTHGRIGERFLVESLGARELRGVREPVSLYRVVRPTRVRSTAEVAARGIAPLVGRERELESLIEAWEDAQLGRGRTVIVTSEPGVGKSRLALQVKKRVADRAHTWFECRCTPYARGTALRPFADLLEEGLDWNTDDDPSERLGKLGAELRRRRLPVGETLPLLAEFLGIPPAAGYERAEMSADFRRFGILDSLTAWLVRVSQKRPMLLLIEDLHWCDSSSLELIGRLVREAPKARLLVMGTARPEFEIPWSDEPRVEVVTLARFGKPEARQLLAEVDSAASLSEEVLDAIVARADGVPLYLEELTKAVLESGTGDSSSSPEIPATLQDSLTARLDRLSSARDVAQHTAVLGRVFSFELALACTGFDESALRSGLARLVEAKIVIAHGDPPEASYEFKHALIQEAAYASLLRRTRRELHARVVDALLTRFPERAAASPELVARHAEGAGQADTAIRYYQSAGLHAQERSANEDAIGLLQHAIDLIAKLDEAERDRRELPLQLLLGAALTGARGYAHHDRMAAFERARELAEAVGDRSQLSVARIGVAISHATSGRNEEALALGEQVLADAEKNGDRELLLHGHYQVGQCYYHHGRFAISLEECEKAIEVYDPELHHRSMFSLGGDTGIAALGHATWCHWHLGHPDRALTRAKETYEYAERLGYPFGLGFSKGTLAVVQWLRRDYAAMRVEAAEQLGIGERYRFPFHVGVGKALHGAARVFLEDPDGMAEATAGIGVAAQSGIGTSPMFMALLAEVQAALGNHEQAAAVVDSALTAAAGAGMAFWNAELHRLKGELALRMEPGARSAERARTEFREAIEIARQQGSKMSELRAATSLARVEAGNGHSDDARAQLSKVYADFDEGLELADLRDARALLGAAAT